MADIDSPIASLNCDRLTEILNENGFSLQKLVVPKSGLDLLITHFIDDKCRNLDSWAGEVLNCVLELFERIRKHQKAIDNINLSTKYQEVTKEALLAKVEDLQKKLCEYESKGKSLEAKLQVQDNKKLEETKSMRLDDTQIKKLKRNFEYQIQEYERRYRQKELENDKLKEKLKQLLDKEKEANSKHRQLLSQYKQNASFVGDVSFLSNASQSNNNLSRNTSFNTSFRGALPANSANNASSHNISFGSTISPTASPIKKQSAAAPASVSLSNQVTHLTSLVEAVEKQRMELVTRNEELEDQVRDLCAELKDLRNAAHTGRKIEQFGGRGGKGKTNTMTDDSLNPPHLREDSFDDGPAPHSEDVRSGGAEHASTAVQFGTAKKMYEKILEQQREIDRLQHKLSVSRMTFNESDELILELRDKNRMLHEDNDNLRCELNARPTVRQWTEAQRHIMECEEKLHDLIVMRGDAKEMEAWRKHLPASERIKIDKRNYELGLWILDSVPKTVMKEVLQCVCRELDITDISEIQHCIAKMKAVVKTVPQMELFITQVCTYVLERHSSLKGFVFNETLNLYTKRPAGQPSQMDQVLPALKKWWKAAQLGMELDAFEDKLMQELYRREQIMTSTAFRDEKLSDALRTVDRELASKTSVHRLPSGGADTLHDDDSGISYLSSTAVEIPNKQISQYWEHGGRLQWLQRDHKQLSLQIVRDLVDFQVEVMMHKQNLLYATEYVRDKPDIIVNRIIAHIQYLFEIRSLEGILPRLNQIYLQLEEMTNFLTMIRPMVFGSKATAANTPNAVLFAEIQKRLSSSISSNQR